MLKYMVILAESHTEFERKLNEFSAGWELDSWQFTGVYHAVLTRWEDEVEDA